MHALLTRIGTGLAAAGLVALAATTSNVPASAHPTIDIAVANWKFTPAKITIPVGDPTVLRLTTTSGVHGIQSDELGIPLTHIPNGKVIEVTFTPKKVGTYIIHCAIFCGPGHPNMTLTIVVADRPAAP